MRKFKVLAAAVALVGGGQASPAAADLGQWFRKEVKPVLSGSAPLVVKPYVSVKSGDNVFRLASDALEVRVGGVTVKTRQLQKRLVQAGCVIETGGNVLGCAPDVVAREVRSLVAEPIGRGDQTPNTHPGASAPPVLRHEPTTRSGAPAAPFAAKLHGFSPVRAGACATPVGACPLHPAVWLPVGASCTCMMLPGLAGRAF